MEPACCCLEAGIWCSEAILSWVVRCLGRKTQKVKSCHQGRAQDRARSPTPAPRACTPQLARHPAAGCSRLQSCKKGDRGAGAAASTGWVRAGCPGPVPAWGCSTPQTSPGSWRSPGDGPSGAAPEVGPAKGPQPGARAPTSPDRSRVTPSRAQPLQPRLFPLSLPSKWQLSTPCPMWVPEWGDGEKDRGSHRPPWLCAGSSVPSPPSPAWHSHPCQDPRPPAQQEPPVSEQAPNQRKTAHS